MEKLTLEASTNSHIIEAESIKSKPLKKLGGNKLIINGPGIVVHGEHGVICTEEKHVIKLVQQEYNPITQELQNAFD